MWLLFCHECLEFVPEAVMGRDRVPTCAYMPVHQDSMMYLYGSNFHALHLPPSPFPLPRPFGIC